MLHAAVQALLYEDMARDVPGALRLLARNVVSLQPAHDHGVATPLAQVVSASMPLFVVTLGIQRAFGALLEEPPPALRFGSADAQCRERLARLRRDMDEHVATRVCRSPLEIGEVIRASLVRGDDCHARTGAANELLIGGLTGLDEAVAARLSAMTGLVLPLLMAAAAAALRHHRCDVAAIGGNGVDFGVRGGKESAWRCVTAQSPRGSMLAGMETRVALPAIGDSVLVDHCGLGGQVDAPGRRVLLDPLSGIVDSRRVCETQLPPGYNLAILDGSGEAGLIGRGSYSPPVELFTPGRGLG